MSSDEPLQLLSLLNLLSRWQHVDQGSPPLPENVIRSKNENSDEPVAGEFVRKEVFLASMENLKASIINELQSVIIQSKSDKVGQLSDFSKARNSFNK